MKKILLFVLAPLLLILISFLTVVLIATSGDGGDDCSSTGDDVGAEPVNSASKEQIAKYMFSYLKSKGMDDEHACALIGYSDGESGLAPSIKQIGDQSESMTGWGLFQVTPITRLKNFAKNKNMDWKGTKVQLEYAWTELHHAVDNSGNVTGGAPDWLDIYGHGVSINEWWSMKDVGSLAGIYTDCFGRGATSHNKPNDPHVTRAKAWYAKLSGTQGESGSGNISDGENETNVDSNCEDGNNGLGVTGAKVSYFDDLEPYISKYLEKNSPYNLGGAPSNLDNDDTALSIGTDCSGFVGWAFGKIGIHFTGRPSTFSMFPSDVEVIDEKEAKAGDLVFFDGKSAPNHVGVYIGNGDMIDDQNKGIIKEKVHASYWSDLQFARVKKNLIPKQYLNGD